MTQSFVHALRSSPGRVIAPAAMFAAVLMLGGCATGGMGGYPQDDQSGSPYPGSPYPDASYPGQYPGQQYPASQLVGRVQGVDANGGRILLDTQASGYGSGGSRVELYFDQRAQVAYQGQVYPVGGLEPGDEIRVDTAQADGRLWARSIELLRNVRDGQGGGSYGGGDLRGEVGYVDTRSRFVELGGGSYGAARRIHYDERTTVEYQGQRSRPENLQRGDIVRIQARQYGNEVVAERIWVEGNANRR